MKVNSLFPKPTGREGFRKSLLGGIPNSPGCYVLSTFDGTILYVGLAVNLRRRVGQHLDTDAKMQKTSRGRAILVHWVETTELQAVERGWLNLHVAHDGNLPTLNKIASPLSI